MKNSKLLFWAFADALGIVAYVSAVAFFLFNAQKIFGVGDGTDKFTDPLIVLLLFIVSAVITGSLFLGRPVYLFFNGEKGEGIRLFFYTLAFLIIALLVVFTARVGLQQSKVKFITTRGNADIIRLKNFQSNREVVSPLTIEGEARGTWYFEASFPVVLVDWDGRIITQGIAQAQPDPDTGEVVWMTENFVPFKATLEFDKPEDIGEFSRRGALILRKDNPSGLPEHDDALEVSILFK